MTKTAKKKVAISAQTGANVDINALSNFVPKEAYDKLLAAFEALIIRENLDIQLQQKYRTDAGLL